MKKNRLIFIGLILFIAFGALFIRLFDMTIINGPQLREQADNSRTKQINKKAARGNIYDADGNLLAGNIPVYNLNVYMDRFKRVSQEDKNAVLLELIHILEEDGVSYLEDFFLDIFEYKYVNEGLYFTSNDTPKVAMVKVISENNLIADIIQTREVVGSGQKLYYYPINRIMDYLEIKGKNLPIEVTTGDQISIKFIENDRYNLLVENGQIQEGESAREFLIRYIANDSSLFYNLLEHPLSRKVVYDIAKQKGLVSTIELTGITYVSDLDYIENKAKLSHLSNGITLESDAKSDFINLVKDNSLDSLLTSITFDDDSNLVVPAEILINQLNAKGIDSEVAYDIDEANEKIILKYIDENNESVETPLDYLIRMAEDNHLLDDFIVNGKVLNLAENSLFNAGIYPRIYTSDWRYVFNREKSDIQKRNRVEETASAQELLQTLIERNDLIEYDTYESFGIISIYNKVNAAGYRAYEPIVLANNLSDRTLVEIEEKMPKDLGFEVVVQPSRYYPNGNSFSHSLGYIGKLSGQAEIDEYINKRGYDGDDVVGKTGLEESFEDTLRGTNGNTIVFTDVMGNTTETIQEIPPVPGNNIYTTINLEFQEEVEKILRDAIYAKASDTKYSSYFGPVSMTHVPGAETGAVVVSNVNTGEVLASVSYPDYDPNIFVNGISNTDWSSLSGSEGNSIYEARPLLNLVVQGALQPGSTFKTVTALAALENGMSPNQNITCYGFIELGNSRFNDLAYTLRGETHGNTDLYKALEVSCNYYFFSLALGYNPNVEDQLDMKVTLSDIEETVDQLQLNQKTGIEINVPVESTGYSPSLYGKQNLVRGMIRSFLNENIQKYIKEGIEFTPESLQQRINEIVSWVEKGPDMTRDQVIFSLDDMGFEPLKPLENEYVGLADRLKYTYLNQAVWTDSDSLNMVIGQGQNAYTPLQMNQLAGTIATEGKIVKPTFVKEIKNYDNSQTIFKNEAEFTESPIKAENFQQVKEGMRRASLSSSRYSQLPFQIANKTGTAESDAINPATGKKYSPFAWDISFGPFDNPEIAVTAVLVQGGRSVDASTVVSDIYYAYYKYVKQDPAFTNERSENEETANIDDLITDTNQNLEEAENYQSDNQDNAEVDQNAD